MMDAIGGSTMPLAVLAKLLTRVALLAGVIFLRRRARGGIPVPPSHRTPGMGGAAVPEWLRALGLGGLVGRGPDVLEGARLAAFALAFAAFAAAALVLTSAGTTLTVLGPRWVGITMLALAALFAAAAVREATWLRHAVSLRRRRRRAEQLSDPR
jgi:hypothetical protein